MNDEPNEPDRDCFNCDRVGCPGCGNEGPGATNSREPDPDCERCEGSGLDPDEFFVDRDAQTWTHAPCSECLPEDDGTTDPVAERIRHSGPDTKFCVLCLSGEHERVDEVPAVGQSGSE